MRGFKRRFLSIAASAIISLAFLSILAGVFAIVLLGNNNYQSSDINVTQEDGSAHANISAESPYNSLLAYWNFDKSNSTTSYDFTHHNYNMVHYGNSTVNTTCNSGYNDCANFDGVNDYMEHKKVLIYNVTNFTFSLWVNARVLVTGPSIGIIAQEREGTNTGYGVQLESLNRVRICGYTCVLTAPQAYNYTNSWHHIVATGNDTNFTIYIDGVLNATGARVWVPNAMTNSFTLGKRPEDASNARFNGSLDEVMVFNISLNDSQVLEIFRNQSQRFVPYGTQTFSLGNLGNNDSLNVSLDGWETGFNSNISVQINGENIINISNGSVLLYNISSGFENGSLIIYYYSSSNNFYSPIVSGNITVLSAPYFPNVSFTGHTPSNNSIFNGNSITINLTSTDNSAHHFTLLDFDRSLIGWLRMDEINNTNGVADISTWSNNFTNASGAFQNDTGKFGKSFQFDGVNDVLNAPSGVYNFSINDSFTLMAWVYPFVKDNENSERGIMGRYTGATGSGYYYFTIDGTDGGGATDKLEFRMSGNNNTVLINQNANTTIANERWTHVAVTFNGSQVILYKDGAIESGGNIATNAVNINSSAVFQIGSAGSSAFVFNGTIDEAIIFNRALDSLEISAIYNASTAQYNHNFTQLSSGSTYTYRAHTLDTAGNINESELRSTGIDTTLPVVIFGERTDNNSSNASRTWIYANVSVIETNEANITFSLSNSSGNVNTTTLSAGNRIFNWTGLGNGTYMYNVSVTDLAGNLNVSETRTITLDTGLPNGTLISPANNTYSSNTSQNFTANFSDSSGLKNASLYIYNSTGLFTTIGAALNGLTASIGNLVESLVDGIYTWFYRVFDRGENVYTSGNFTITIDTINPQISFIDPTPSNASGATQQVVFNVSINDTNLANVTYNWNGTISIYNTSASELFNSGNGLWIFTVTQSNLSIGSNYVFNISAKDLANNINATETRTIVANSKPSFVSIAHTPNTTLSLDPNIALVITLNVSDSDSNIERAILQWKNSSLSWDNATNVTMSNISTKNITTIFNGSFIPLFESNYSFRIWANDTQGDSNISVETNLSVFLDCTWNITPSDLGAVVGWDQNKFISNITLNNSGDAAYSNTNCSLDFRFTYDLAEGRIFFNHDSVKPSTSITLAAGNSTNVIVNASFLSEVKQDSAIITVNEFRARSDTSSRNASLTLVSNQNGPYLYEKVTSYPTSVSLTAGNMSLNGYIRNLMGSSTLNISNTAYNVTVAWALSGGLTNSSGNLSTFIDNITDSDLHYYPVTLTFSDLASMSSGIQNITLTLSGYNQSGYSIRDADNNTNINETISITFLCYNISDSVYVTACGSLDGDYVASSSSSTTSSGSSGGGSGGGPSASAKTVKSRVDFEIKRGKINNVSIPFTNKNKNASLMDLKISMRGKLTKYMSLSPSFIASLGPGESINLIITITSPTFIDLGRQEFDLIIDGKVGSESYKEQQTVVFEVNDINREEEESLIVLMKTYIEKFNSANFKYDELDKRLKESENALTAFNYHLIQDNYNFIEFAVKTALESKSILDEIQGLVEKAELQSIETPGTKRLLKLALLSLERNEFEQALTRVKEARVTYALEVKGEFASLRYYLIAYPRKISFGAIFFIFFSFATFHLTRLQLLKRKIRYLQDEERILQELMRVVQIETFKEKRMSMEEYRGSMLHYEKRLSDVIGQIITLENKRAHALKFARKETRLLSERARIISLIKQLQKEYLREGKVEAKAYELKLESYNKRIGEIDEDLATLEAKKAMRKVGRYFSNIIPKIS